MRRASSRANRPLPTFRVTGGTSDPGQGGANEFMVALAWALAAVAFVLRRASKRNALRRLQVFDDSRSPLFF
jgi:hypothetical protein